MSVRESASGVQTAPTPHLRRVLTLADLIFYGIVLTSPIAAVPLFGEAQVLSKGHAVTTLLVSMVAMALTAVSFGRMATVYPSAGSVYTYISRGLNPHLGFLLGWAMFLEYLFQPILNSLYAALTIQRLIPQVPFALLAALAVGFMTYLTWLGIRTTARTNQILLTFMVMMTAVFLFQAFRYIFLHQHWQGLFSIQPIYDPRTFSLRSLAAGTSLAALTYIGFDGVSLLAEEAENPRRNVLLATVLVCVFTGLFSGLQVYLAQRVWPDYRTLANPETAFMDVAHVVGGYGLFAGYGAILLVSSLACGLAGHVGAARLLYSMGRDNVLPRKVFGHIDPKRSNPSYSVLIVGILAYVGTQTIGWEKSAEILNYGALLAFMGVNLAVLRHFWFSRDAIGKRKFFVDAVLPGIGLLFCFLIFFGLQHSTHLAGEIWLAVGLLYAAVKTRGFRRRPVMIDFNGS